MNDKELERAQAVQDMIESLEAEVQLERLVDTIRAAKGFNCVVLKETTYQVLDQ